MNFEYSDLCKDYLARVRAFMDEHDYRIERMLLALIETEAYGVP